MTSRSTTIRAALFAMLLSAGRVSAAEPEVATLDAAPSESSGFVIEPGDSAPDDEGDEDVAPREGDASEGASTPGRASRSGQRTRHHESDGPRRVALPRGASLARVERLGLGSRDAAHVLLHGTPDETWVAASGRTVTRYLRWPVDEGGFGRGVGYVRTDRPEVPHNGVDIVAPRGSVVHAAADGLVVYSDNGLRGYGNCVIVLHADGRSSLYAHLDRATVPAGYRVRRGERIGFVGSTGHSQGPHLHFEVRREGRVLDPMHAFRGTPWVEGRARLTELRARPDGGHSREHLGTITPDYASEPERPAAPAPAPRAAPSPVVKIEATPAGPVRTPFVPRLHLANSGPHAPRVTLAQARLHVATRNQRLR